MTVLVESIGRPSHQRSRVAADAIAIVTGSLIVAGLAQISISLPFTPVPITGQTFGVLLVGASLGAVRGGLSIGLYLLEGALGAPFFAGAESGADLLAASSATGGYLWGFVAAASFVGFLSKRQWDRKLGSAIGAMFLGEIVIYVFGVIWLSGAINVSAEKALELGLYPFVVGDAIKLGFAAAVLPTARKLVERRS